VSKQIFFFLIEIYIALTQPFWAALGAKTAGHLVTIALTTATSGHGYDLAYIVQPDTQQTGQGGEQKLQKKKRTVKPVNSTPLNSSKPLNSNMSFGTESACPYDNVPLNSTSLQIALLFLWSQGYVLFAGFSVINFEICIALTDGSRR
jgi:hypothetical protein